MHTRGCCKRRRPRVLLHGQQLRHNPCIFRLNSAREVQHSGCVVVVLTVLCSFFHRLSAAKCLRMWCIPNTMSCAPWPAAIGLGDKALVVLLLLLGGNMSLCGCQPWLVSLRSVGCLQAEGITQLQMCYALGCLCVGVCGFALQSINAFYQKCGLSLLFCCQ